MHKLNAVKLIAFVSCLAAGLQLSAQDVDGARGSISGKTMDMNSGQPVEYANVIAYSLPDSALVGGVVSGSSGFFRIENLKIGSYFVKAQFVGYNPVFKGGIVLSAKKSTVFTGTLNLEPRVDALEEVSVTARKNLVETRIDKKIISVDPILLSTGGTAVDVLKNAPSVSVDAEGNLSLRGSDNVTVLVDGRQSPYTSLDQVPATIIDHVEIVTNPSAKYGANGMAGIVNIITKKRVGQGFNGQVSGNVGTGNRYNGTVNLNYGKGKFNSNVILDLRQSSAEIKNEQRVEKTIPVDYLKTNNAQISRKGTPGSVKLGIDYNINDKNTLSLSTNLLKRKITNDQQSRVFVATDNLIENDYTMSSGGKTSSYYYTPTLSYKKTTNLKDESITASIEAYVGSLESETEITYPEQVQNNDSRDTYQTYDASVDYERPLFKDGKIETGIKLVKYRGSYASEQEYISDKGSSIVGRETFSNISSGAAYVEFSNKYKHLSYQAGLREEGYITTFEDGSTNDISKRLYHLVPSVALSYTKNEKIVYQANYTKRMDDVDPVDYSPYIVKDDLNSWRQGNPALVPAHVNSYEIGVSTNHDVVSTSNTVYVRQTVNTFTKKQYYTRDTALSSNVDNEILVSTLENGKPVYAYGIEHFHNFTFSKKLKHAVNVTLYSATFADSSIKEYFNLPYLSWMCKYNLTISPLKSVDVGLSFSYNASYLSMMGGSGRNISVGNSAGRVGETWHADASLKKAFWDGKASLSLRLSDIFNSSKFTIDSYPAGSHTFTKRTRDGRTLFFGFMYKINGGVKTKKRQNDQMDADM